MRLFNIDADTVVDLDSIIEVVEIGDQRLKLSLVGGLRVACHSTVQELSQLVPLVAIDKRRAIPISTVVALLTDVNGPATLHTAAGVDYVVTRDAAEKVLVAAQAMDALVETMRKAVTETHR